MSECYYYFLFTSSYDTLYTFICMMTEKYLLKDSLSCFHLTTPTSSLLYDLCDPTKTSYYHEFHLIFTWYQCLFEWQRQYFRKMINVHHRYKCLTWNLIIKNRKLFQAHQSYRWTEIAIVFWKSLKSFMWLIALAIFVIINDCHSNYLWNIEVLNIHQKMMLIFLGYSNNVFIGCVCCVCVPRKSDTK